MNLKHSICCLIFLAFGISIAQQNQLSNKAEISIITIGPGSFLYDSFGHNAIRVQDKEKGIDWAFNYGRFDFDQPNFILNFCKGKLNYELGLAQFAPFAEGYRRENRWMKMQVLNLNQQEKQRFYNFLIDNVQPENKNYLYHFFYNNCATKIKDVAQSTSNNNIVFNTPSGFEQKTFRKLIHDYIPQNSWGSFGIDLALGSKIDKLATPEEHMFLPDYLSSFFANATTKNGTPIAKPSTIILNSTRGKKPTIILGSPLFVFGIIALLILWITYKDHKQQKRSRWLDIILFSSTGLIGVFLFLLWFATDHTDTAYNYNLLWAFPLNIILISNVVKKTAKKWFINYLKLILIMLCWLCLHWIMEIQLYPIGILPFLIALFIRYWYLISFYKKQ